MVLRVGEKPVIPRTPDNTHNVETIAIEDKWRLTLNGDDVEWQVKKAGVWTYTGSKWLYTDY